jgi:signal transduction histidine kinase
LAVIATAVVTLLAMTPFARVHLPRIDAFIPAYEAALLVNDLITSVLLFGQFSRIRTYALLILACGYLFDALIIVPHALSFPGLFSTQGLMGSGPQTTAWLYCFWHGGFALFILAYGLLAGRGSSEAPKISGATGATIGISVAAIVGLVITLTLLATAGHDLLPVVMQGGDYTQLVTKGVTPTILVLCAIALAVLWPRRNASVLDLWIIVVLCVWFCDVTLSAVVGSARYDLGFYGGRSYGLLAASFLLATMLLEMNRLYGELSDAYAAAERRHAELMASREKLARAQRFEAMAELTSGVAHDFNNLLTVITGGLDLIGRAPGNIARVERLVRTGIAAAKRGEVLTQQLLTFARRQVSRPETVNPNRLLSDFENLLCRAAGEQFDIKLALSAVLNPIHIDTAQFESAVLNLVLNARDAMAEGGCITIETANTVLDAATAARLEVKPGDYVVVAVSDTGVGMAPDVVARAFDPFFTTKGIGVGSGLGLSQVFGFARSADGQVKIYSEPGVGTTVRLYLPKSARIARPTEADLSVLPVRAARGDEVVLVVEDDEQVLELAVEGLADLGYAVVTATNAAQALEIIRGGQRIDVLFSDIIMPGGMNGVQLSVEARRIRPGLKVLLTSGYTASTLAVQHELPEPLELLGKPYGRNELGNKLRLVIGS